MEWEISGDAIKNAKSIFEPEVAGSYEHKRSKEKYSEEERADLFSGLFGTTINDRYERNNNYNIALEGLLPTEARVSLGYTLQELSNNFNEDTGKEYQAFIGASLTQPSVQGTCCDKLRWSMRSKLLPVKCPVTISICSSHTVRLKT